MPHLRPLGDTGLQIAPMVLGGNVFGWTADRKASFAVMDAFVAGGGSMIDTADSYSRWVPGHSGGESETLIGEWLAQSGKRDQVIISTKVGTLAGEGGSGLAPTRIAAACEESLKRLRTDRIDVYFAHKDDVAIPQEAALEAFGGLLEAGKVRFVGASNFTAERLASAREAAGRHGLPSFQVLQPQYNLMSRDHFEGPLQAQAFEHHMGVIPYFGLASGFLTGKYRQREDLGGKARGAEVAALMDRGALEVLSTMDQVAAESGASLSQIALAWVAAQPGVTAPIASATNVDQLENLLGSMSLQLSDEQLSRLTHACVAVPLKARI